MMVKLCSVWCNLPLILPPIFSNITTHKRCLMFGNYLWIPVLGKFWNHRTRGRRTDTKNHQDHCWCYIIFVQCFKRYLFGTGWLLCAKKRHWIPKAIRDILSILPQQGLPLWGQSSGGCSPHSPPWLDNLPQCTACVSQYGSSNHEEVCMGSHRTHEGGFSTIPGHGNGV